MSRRITSTSMPSCGSKPGCASIRARCCSSRTIASSSIASIDRVVNIEHGKARAYRGNYSAFEDQRAAELAEQAALFTRQQREIKHMESFVERFRAKASKARQAQSRLKALERMQRIAPAHVDSPFEFSFAPPDKLPRPLLALEKQSAGYDGRVVLDGINAHACARRPHRAARPQRRGQVDVHEAAGGRAHRAWPARAPRRATCASATSRSISSSSSSAEGFAAREPAALSVPRARRAPPSRSCATISAGFGFRGDRVFEPIAPFSGGEKARLVLALVAYLRPNLHAARRADESSRPGDAPGAHRGAAGLRRRSGARLARSASAAHRGG